MRWLAWCALGALVACGQSERQDDAGASGARAGGAGSAGSGTAGNLETGGVAGEARGGESATGGSDGPVGATAGTSSANGGTGTSGNSGISGSAGATGGASAQGGSGGSSGSLNSAGSSDGGDTGDAGTAGAPPLECAGEYRACGCGCCSGVVPNSTCYYPERGDSLAEIRGEDQALAASPSCDAAGCSIGEYYLCCTTGVDEGTASYETSGYSSDAQYLELRRTGEAERCTSLWIARPGPAPSHPLELPDGWGFDRTFDGACNDEGQPVVERPVIGALGSVRFTGELGCSVDLDFTLFFLADDGSVDAVRFAATAVATPPGRPECE
jgi:hypothetical protein